MHFHLLNLKSSIIAPNRACIMQLIRPLILIGRRMIRQVMLILLPEITVHLKAQFAPDPFFQANRVYPVSQFPIFVVEDLSRLGVLLVEVDDFGEPRVRLRYGVDEGVWHSFV